jgi:glycosyltransferase involved in cell wall biosynthesis
MDGPQPRSGEVTSNVQHSVIIPTYNRADYVAACVRSVLAGGVAGTEAIVVDDGSPEDVASTVRAFGPPVTYVRQANSGPAAARNNGFGHAKGRYVTFLDSDDEWLPGVVPRLIDLLDRHPQYAAVFTDSAMGSPETGYTSFIRTYRPDGLTGIPSRQIEPGVVCMERRPFFHQLSRRNVMFLGSLIIRREVVQKLEAFDPARRGAEDWDLFMRLVLSHDILYCGDIQLAKYLRHPGSLSTMSDMMEFDFINALTGILRKCTLDEIDRKHVQHELKRHWFGWAYQAYDRGDHKVARDRFGKATKALGASPDLLAYWAATYLPPGLIAKLRSTKQALGA